MPKLAQLLQERLHKQEEKLIKIAEIIYTNLEIDGDHHRRWAMEEIGRILEIEGITNEGIPG